MTQFISTAVDAEMVFKAIRLVQNILYYESEKMIQGYSNLKFKKVNLSRSKEYFVL